MALLQVSMFFLLIHSVRSTSFNYPRFEAMEQNLSFQGDAFLTPGAIQLTKNQANMPLNGSIGRAVYLEPIRLYDSATGRVADFTTRFSFIIDKFEQPYGADGFAFFLAPNDSVIPPESGGNCLGLYTRNSSETCFPSPRKSPIVAVKFDTYHNVYLPDPVSQYYDSNGKLWNDDYIGIDVNSVRSVATWNIRSLKNGTGHVWVSYNSSTQNLTVYFTYVDPPVFNGNWLLSSSVNLPSILPEWITVGFSGATGAAYEVHNILSWEFNSTNFPSTELNSTDFPSTALNSTDFPSTEFNSTDSGTGGVKDKNNVGVVTGSVIGVIFLLVGIGLILFVWHKKHNKEKENEDDSFSAKSTDDDYEQGAGPKRFTYEELVLATNKFAEEGKLGEGGFGGVYRGFLNNANTDIAVKRVSRGSKQGKKEFVSEVKIISKLRHRNLVQLVGWCHKKGEFLLVYDYMPNGSLDFHLFKGRSMITWALRYKIALGLASALLYLHEEWEQCVVHRDVKSSNVMLDSSFNAKLGDFGLARFADHDSGMQTTMVAGTMGYLAPECLVTGKAGKESDVYSFGVVALEIACGRRVVEHKEEESKVGLVSWVWGLYGSGRLLEAADAKLDTDFDEQQMIRLMIVGLWCANPDHHHRPSVKQAISVLNFEAPVPDLPFKMSAPNYFTPSVKNIGLSYTSSSSGGNQSEESSDSYSTYYSQKSTSASATLLQLAT